MDIYYRKLWHRIVNTSLQTDLSGGNTHDGNLKVIQLRTGQYSIRERLHLTEPLPTCGMQVATLEKDSGIIGIP